MSEQIFVKDDEHFFAMIEQLREAQHLLNLPETERPQALDAQTLRAELERLRQERRQLVRAYHVIIEPVDGRYQAYAPAVPDVVGQGKTPQKAKEHLAAALRLHLLARHAQGETPPEENRLVDVVAVSLA
ncbi:MAG: type II toxin-antitoxin system HicB family antitoxin [Anaerolineae bacterium]